MKLLKKFNLKMEGKLLLSFIIMIFIVILQGFFGVKNISNINIFYEELWNSSYNLGKTEDNLTELRLKVFQFIGTVKPEEMDIFQKDIDVISKQIMTDLEKYPQLSEAKILFAETAEEYRKIMQLHNEFFQTKKAYDLLYSDSQKNFQHIKEYYFKI